MSSSSSRRFIAGVIRLALVVLAFVVIGRYFSHRGPARRHVRVQKDVPPQDSLRPGDIRIYSTDSAVDLVLSGNNILAGLSPKTVAKVKQDLEKSTSRDTSGGLGASISQIVKSSVAGAIGTHASFPLSDIRDIRNDGGRIVVDWKSGGGHDLFGDTKVNGSKVSNAFSPEDAERFVEAVRARIGLPAARN
jgi:hypothetical protein